MKYLISKLHYEYHLISSDNVAVRWIPSARPIAIFLDESNKELERVSLEHYSDFEVRELLKSKVK